MQNISQLKQQFTRLTGIEAKTQPVRKYLTEKDIKLRLDFRTTKSWTLLVNKIYRITQGKEDLNKLTIKELKAKCRKRGVKNYSKLCKTALVSVLFDITNNFSIDNLQYKTIDELSKFDRNYSEEKYHGLFGFDIEKLISNIKKQHIAGYTATNDEEEFIIVYNTGETEGINIYSLYEKLSSSMQEELDENLLIKHKFVIKDYYTGHKYDIRKIRNDIILAEQKKWRDSYYQGRKFEYETKYDEKIGLTKYEKNMGDGAWMSPVDNSIIDLKSYRRNEYERLEHEAEIKYLTRDGKLPYLTSLEDVLLLPRSKFEELAEALGCVQSNNKHIGEFYLTVWKAYNPSSRWLTIQHLNDCFNEKESETARDYHERPYEDWTPEEKEHDEIQSIIDADEYYYNYYCY